MKWLAKNWLWILITISIFVVGGLVIDLIKDNKQYKQNIKNLDYEISRKERVIEAKGGIISDLMDERTKDKAAADKKIPEMKKNQKKELAQISFERDEWKAKVKEMPPSVLVIEIKAILKTEGDIWERPDGILFSLVAAKDCLAILGDFSLVEERDRFKDDYNKAMSRVDDLKKIITSDEFIFYNFDAICFTKDKIIGEEREKFNLSEKRNVQSWWKGAKAGGIIGSLAGLFFGLVLGK